MAELDASFHILLRRGFDSPICRWYHIVYRTWPSEGREHETFRIKDEEQQYRQILWCESGSLSFRYLGVPIHYRKLKNSDWYLVETRLEGKFWCWKGKLLSYADPLVLVKSVLTSLPMFMLSFLEIPKGVRKRLDFWRSRFFLQSDENKRKYILTKWNIICRPIEQGGLVIEVLELKNKCLLSKWIFKLLNEEGVWQELQHNKYLNNKTLSKVEAKPTDSPFWKGLMRLRMISVVEAILKLGMVPTRGFGKIFGWVILLWHNNIHHCIILCNRKMLLLQMF